MAYDIVVMAPEQWLDLVQSGLRVVVDPLVLRLGQFFLKGPSRDAGENQSHWEAIAGDLGAVISFFDLVVLNDKFPAFNYKDTFDEHLGLGDSLGELVNTRGDKTLVDIDMEHYLYYEVKSKAIGQLRERIAAGPFVPQAASDEILATLTAVQYEWEPSLWDLEPELPDEGQRRLARFLLGQLVFTGYAQQMGSQHVLSPKRARLITSVGLRSELASATAETQLYDQLHRRIRDAGPGWRDDELPWTPSFLPFLLKQINPYREGPDILLERAKDLRNSPAVERYRKLRADLTQEDGDRSEDARRELSDAADAVARELDSGRKELEWTRHLLVEVLPKAVGLGVGAAAGTLAAGPPGTAVGAVTGLATEEALKPVQERLWGWCLDKVPFRSARKLLARAVRAELDSRQELELRLRAVWETGRRE